MKFYYSFYEVRPNVYGTELMVGPLPIDNLLTDYQRAKSIADNLGLELKDHDLNLGSSLDKIIKVFAVKLLVNKDNKKRLESLKEAYKLFIENL